MKQLKQDIQDFKSLSKIERRIFSSILITGLGYLIYCGIQLYACY